MRLSLAVLSLALALVAAAPQQAPPPPPTPATRGESAYKRSLRELKLRIKFPEFFRRADGGDAENPAPSQVCVDVCPDLPGEFIECTDVPAPVDKKKKKKRELELEGKEMLSPENAARFFLGRGTYTHDNGTTITDAHYLSTGEKRRAHQMKRSRLANWAVGKMGNMVMDMGMPIYRRWKTHYADLPDYAFMLSDTHGFRMRDLPHIERALLETPGWDEIEVAEWRISRRFLELANQL